MSGIAGFLSPPQDGSMFSAVTPAKMIAGLAIAVFIFIVVYYAYRLFAPATSYYLIDAPISAKTAKTFTPASFPDLKLGYSYTISYWMYIDEWSTGAGIPKPVLFRAKGPTDATLGKSATANASPLVYLYPNENKLAVRVSTQTGGTKDNVTPYASADGTGYDAKGGYFTETHVCDVPNIPLQAWVNITIVVNINTVDVYMNGKLVRSCQLKGMVVSDPTDNLYVAPFGGFGGYISRLQVMNYAATADAIYNIYLGGPATASLLGNLFTLDKVQVFFTNPGGVQSSVSF